MRLIHLKSLLFISLISLICFHGKASHIRAGQITAKRIDKITNTFEFTFTGFRDTNSNVRFGNGIFDFGDGNKQIGNFRRIITYVGNDTEMVQWILVHTYDAPGIFIVSYQEHYRNFQIVNMDNSGRTDFYVETKIVIDPFFGPNDTPQTLIPPIDEAAVGVKFIHNARAFDPDGASLSYRFVVNKQAKNIAVNNYRELINPEFYISIPYDQADEDQLRRPKLSLDPVTGDLVWDAPGDIMNKGDHSEYNVAFVIEEWRYIPATNEWVQLGYVERDMQIIVKITNNNRPDLTIPDDVCVEAGMKVKAQVQGTDPDGQEVKLEAFGGPFVIDGNKATYQPFPADYQNLPAELDFEWDTQCGHVRLRPYAVTFKVTDNPESGPKLVNFSTFEITVVGPAPKGLKTIPQAGRSIQLEWDEYSCSNAEKIQIWRKVGSADIEFHECSVGMPPHTGYELIDEVTILGPGNQQVTSYLDDNHGRGLAPGARYCYRLVAVYPLPAGGKSYVSYEVCQDVRLDAPAITKVDVVKTDEADGTILLQWVPPYEINQNTYPPAYKYDVFRAEGQSPDGSYTQIASGITDTTFTDTGLNTLSTAYNYFIRLHDGNGILVDSSATASSVKLQLKPLLAAIELSWLANVPWSNSAKKYPYHYIYRDQVDPTDENNIVLIDSVNVMEHGFTYHDNGQFNDTKLDEQVSYCYYVTTQGSYDNPVLPEPLINHSQIGCAQPNDSIPPCEPISFVVLNAMDCEAILANLECGANSYTQKLSWEVGQTDDCEDITHYNVYFSSTGNDGNFEIVGTPETNSFEHTNLTSLKGCYKVTAVDRSGNESDFTDVICNDNCPVFKMPNVFTPNNDGNNDVFGPLHPTSANAGEFDVRDCPRFVTSLVFKVFDQVGDEIYVYDSYENVNGININWDGTNNQGQKLPSGVYFYVVELHLDVLDTKNATKMLKGWVQILR